MRERLILAALLLALGASGVLAIPARLHVGDPYTWREEGRSLVLIRHLFVPEWIARKFGEEDGQYFVRNPQNGLYYSKYGVMNGVLSVPPLLAEMLLTRDLPAWDSEHRRLFLGFHAVLLSLLAAWLLFRLGILYGASAGASALFVTLSFFCTFLLYYARSPTSEVPQLLFFLAFLERVARYRASGFTCARHAHFAWLFLLCLVLTKLVFAALVPLTALALLAGPALDKRMSPGEVLPRLLRHVLPGAALAAILPLLMNWWKFGGPFQTGYVWARHEVVSSVPLHRIFANLFLSEQWGLPTHFPLIFLAAFGARRFFRSFRFDTIFLASVFAMYFVLIGSLPFWRGEWGYGPRYFLFLLPALSLPALPLLDTLLAWRPGRGWITPAAGTLAAVALVYSFSLQVNVARLDPFFFYRALPPAKCTVPPAVLRHFQSAHFGRISAEAWSGREDLWSVWWVRELGEACPPDTFTGYLKHLGLWLKRTNFYWFSPRD